MANILSAVGLPNLGATSPQTLWSVYGQPDAYRGAGQSIAVFGSGASAPTISDLALFEQAHHLPSVPVTVHNVGPGSFTDTSGTTEWDIDTQASTGMAPDVAGLTLYFGDSLVDATVENLLTTWVNDPNGPAQANASFGECERTPLDPVFLGLPGDISQDPNATFGLALGNNLQPVAEQTLRQAAIEGRTLFSSSGDTGSSCPVLTLPVIGPGNGVLNQVVPLTSYPASSPYAVAVGGTVLYTNPTTPESRFAEYAWTFTGGGDTLLIGAPAYQQGTSGLFLPCLATPDGQLTNLGQPCRGIPDVAAQSGDALTNNYGIIASGQPSQGGGTSLSSPLVGGNVGADQPERRRPGVRLRQRDALPPGQERRDAGPGLLRRHARDQRSLPGAPRLGLRQRLRHAERREHHRRRPLSVRPDGVRESPEGGGLGGGNSPRRMVGMSDEATFRVKSGLAEMLKGGVIMDVVDDEQARIAEDAGACAVMALERVPSDIRRDGGVARMSDPLMIRQIQEAVTIPVMAKARIGHFVEAQVLEALEVDYIDESEVLTPADEANHIDKWGFKVPFVCGATNLGEALRRIGEGAAMIRSKGEAGTGDVVEAVRHMREIVGQIRRVTRQRPVRAAGSRQGVGRPARPDSPGRS